LQYKKADKMSEDKDIKIEEDELLKKTFWIKDRSLQAF